MDALKNPAAKWSDVKLEFKTVITPGVVHYGHEDTITYQTLEEIRRLSDHEVVGILNRLVAECAKHLSPAEVNRIIVKGE